MDADEQMMLQLWLTNLRDKLVADETQLVLNELNTALGQIEEDQREVGNPPAGGL